MKGLMTRQISKELKKAEKLRELKRPRTGWIRAIREALSMSTAQLGKRVGVVQQRISAIEQAEVRGGIKLKTLEEVAHALDCDLIYALVPRDSLENFLEEQAHRLAALHVNRLTHSMELEDQPISEEEKKRQIRELAETLRTKKAKKLWENS